MSNWSREEVRLLLNEYKRYPCLYMVKTKQYTNKHARVSALENIQKAFEPLKLGITVNEMKNKFSGLKATFLAEYKKYKDSIGTGKAQDEIYHPTLWYYEDLQFVLDHVEIRTGIIDSIERDEALESQSQDGQDDISGDDIQYDTVENYVVNASDGVLLADEDYEAAGSSSATAVPPPRSLYCNKKTSTKRKVEHNDAAFEEASKALYKLSLTIEATSNMLPSRGPHVTPNEHVTFAEFVATKMQQLTEDEVRLEVEENITKILYEGIRKCRKKTDR